MIVEVQTQMRNGRVQDFHTGIPWQHVQIFHNFGHVLIKVQTERAQQILGGHVRR